VPFNWYYQCKRVVYKHRLSWVDPCERNAVEGEFGTGKRRYGLGRIMAHLKDTSECVIAMHFFIMNMEHKWRLLFGLFLKALFEAFFDNFISISIVLTAHSVNPV
jgi:hypothetical protein